MHISKKKERQTEAVKEIKSIVKLFVFTDEKHDVTTIFDYDYPDEFPPAICFPAEPKSLYNAWRASINPLGVPVANCTYDWSLVAVHDDSGKSRFYLRDPDGVSKKINWGFAHQAVYFTSWKSYVDAMTKFLVDLSVFEKELYDLTERFKFAHKSGHFEETKGRGISKWAEEIYKRLLYWNNNMVLWISKHNNHKTRLFMVQDRLMKAQDEISKLEKEFTAGYNKKEISNE